MRKWLILILLGLLLTVGSTVFAATSVTFKILDTSGKMKVTALQIDPNPPAVRKPLKFIVTGPLSVPIKVGATVKVTTFLNTMNIGTTTLDLCKEMSNSELPCPIAPTTGTAERRLSFAVPVQSTIPPFVTVREVIEAKGADGILLFKIETSLKFVP